MFKKLLSNLPYNPSLIGQVSFYAQRLHRESTMRRAGFVMILVAMLIQMFAVISPPQSSLQASPNTDLISGGFSTKQEAVNKCRDNAQNYKKIMNNFGVSCENISDATVTNIGPRDFDGKLYSMGRLAYGVQGETPIRVEGVGNLYVRHFWSLNHEPSYKALKLKNEQGKTLFILFSCGNIVSIGIPQEAPPQDVCENKPGLQTKKEDCDVCPNRSGVQNNKSGCDVCPNKPGVQTNNSQCDVCPNIDGEQTNESECKPCGDSQTKTDLTACLQYSKKAENTTQNIKDANGTTAKPGDTITYSLSTKNTGKIDIKNYVVNEGIGDVLDYADVVDLHGGTKAEYDIVSWPATTIKAGATLSNKITVKVKSSLPNTPASSSDPEHFNMIMTNVYGDTVSIKLPPSVTKQIEIATTQLPNTGPGTSLIIGFSLTFVIAYFFARSRLLAKELDIVRLDFGNEGGY